MKPSLVDWKIRRVGVPDALDMVVRGGFECLRCGCILDNPFGTLFSASSIKIECPSSGLAVVIYYRRTIDCGTGSHEYWNVDLDAGSMSATIRGDRSCETSSEQKQYR